jgi:hypothetical protein
VRTGPYKPVPFIRWEQIGIVGMVSPALTAAALVLWARSLDGVEVDGVTDLGLVSVLPATAWIAYAMLACGFSLALRERPLSHWLLAFHVLALILMLYALPGVLEAVPRLAAAWRHVGVIEYVTRTGSVDPSIDAYFNWPGFFVLGSFATELAGFKSATVFLDWAPVVNALLYLAPLLVIFRAATVDGRIVWLSIWLFYSTNWVGQDYFSPQAISYFLYLVVLAILLRWFIETGVTQELLTGRLGRNPVWADLLPRSAPELQVSSEQSGLRPLQRGALLAIAIAIMLVSVPTHQLTPFALLLTLTALGLLRFLRAPNLPVILAVAIGAWMSFMAIAYVSGHLDVLAGGVGQIGDTVDANVGSRLRGSSDHVLIVRLRLVLTGLVWLLAILGVRRCLRSERPWKPMAALALAPFALFALQPYGGEVLLRIYFFALPFAVFFVASLFYPEPKGRSTATTAAVAACTLVLLVGTVAARYGNERMEHFTRSEVDAIHYLYDVAPAGSVFVTWGRNLPWKFQDYDKFDYREVTDKDVWTGHESPARAVTRIEALMGSANGADAYLVFTRSQEAENDILALSPPGGLERVERLVTKSRHFTLVYRNPDAAIFVVAARKRT